MSTISSQHVGKLNTARTRGGCSECRRRRRKCDQEKPFCQRCVMNESVCAYPASIEFRDATTWAAEKVKAAKSKRGPAFTTVDSQGSVAEQAQIGVSPRTVSQTHNEHAQHQSASRASPASRSLLISPTSSTLATTLTSMQSAVDLNALWGTNDVLWTADESDSASYEVQVTSNGACPMANLVYDCPADTQFMVDAAQPSNPSHLTTHTLVALSRSDKSCEIDSTSGSPGQHQFIGLQLRANEDVLNQEPADFADHVNRDIFSRSGTTHLSTPSAPISETSIPVGNRLYLAHFVTRVLYLLPSCMQTLKSTVMTVEPVRSAAMAHGAAHMAVTQGSYIPYDGQYRSRWGFQPTHSKRGRQLAAQAGKLVSSDMNISPDMRFATYLFLCYYQLEAGTFNDLWRSIYRLDSLVLKNHAGYLISDIGNVLMRGWSHVRTFAKRVYPLTHPTGLESQSQIVLDELEFNFASTQRAASIGISASRLMFRAMLCKCLGKSGFSSYDGLQDVRLWWHILQGSQDMSDEAPIDNFDTVLDESQIFLTLRSLSTELEHCDVPAEFPVDFEQAISDSVSENNLEAPFFRFSSHDEAMACADYAFAHLACDERLLFQNIAPQLALSTQSDQADRQSTSSNLWLALLLQIAMALDAAECAHRNTYRLGIVSQLFLGALLTGELQTMTFLDEFIQRSLRFASCREDIVTPLRASLRTVRTIRHISLTGRQVFLCSITFNGWTDKEQLYGECEDQFLMVFGKEPDGTFFNDCVPLVETYLENSGS